MMSSNQKDLLRDKCKSQPKCLKSMLNYYEKEDSAFYRRISTIYEIDQIYYPQKQKNHLPLHQQLLKENYLNHQFNFIQNNYQHRERSPTRQRFSTVDLTKLNSKLKSIRIKSYKNIKEMKHNQSQKDMIVLRSKQIRNDPNKVINRKGIMTAEGCRAVNNLIKSIQIGQIRRSSSSCQIQIANPKQTLNNPLVIYPYQNKLKSRKIENNPMILGSIIKKKLKNGDCFDIYGSVNDFQDIENQPSGLINELKMRRKE